MLFGPSFSFTSSASGIGGELDPGNDGGGMKYERTL